MVYALKKIRNTLLGQHFKTFIDHYVLKYLFNKPVLGGRICKWLFLFQEFDFEVVVKPGRLKLIFINGRFHQPSVGLPRTSEP